MKQLRLKSAYVEITSKCNLFCEHCYNNSLITNTEQLSLLALEEIYKDFSQNHISNIALSGGEPFIHTNIREILSLSKQYSIDTQFVTNGVLLDKHISFIKDNPYLNFQISIDGVGEIHNKIRRAQVFSIIDRNIDGLNQYGKYIVFKSTINRLNVGECKRIIEYAISKCIPKITFSMLNLQGRASANERIILDDEASKDVIKELNLLAMEYKDSIEVTSPQYTNSVCPFIQDDNADVSPRVDPSGEVYLCSMFMNPMFSLGNANLSKLTEIIKSERTKRILDFMKAFNLVTECKDCYMHALCSKGCPAQYLNDFPVYRVDSCSFKRNVLLQSIVEQEGMCSR